MDTISLQGAIVARLAGSAELLALVPELSIHGGLMPEEARIEPGGGLVLIQDRESPPEWIHERCRYERHRPTATVHAPATDTPGAKPPAEEIMDVVEDLIDNYFALFDADPKVTLIKMMRGPRQRETVDRRDPAGVRRVQKITADWEVEFEVNW